MFFLGNTNIYVDFVIVNICLLVFVLIYFNLHGLLGAVKSSGIMASGESF